MRLKARFLPFAAPVLLSVGILVRRSIEAAVGDSRQIQFALPPGLPLIRGDIESLSRRLDLAREDLDEKMAVGAIRLYYKRKGLLS